MANRKCVSSAKARQCLTFAPNVPSESKRQAKVTANGGSYETDKGRQPGL